jgi:peptide/nickel transport system substrate-binding protein
MQRRTFLTVTLLATMGVPARAATRGGTLVYGRQTDCIYLDPVHTAQNADIWVSLNLYDTLTQPADDGKSVVPGLASSWDVSQDGKTMTFKLRPDLKFADGSPLTADDVKWSLERAADKATGGEFQFLLASIAGVDAPGDGTVIIRLKRPDPAMLQALATFNAGIVPSKLIMAEPGTTLDDKSKSFAQHPVGSGPFTLKSWNRNSEMVLTRNPHYWKHGADGQPLPYLDNVGYVIVPDDATRILKLKAGEIDAAEFIPYSRVAELKADPKLNMVLFPAAQVNYFTLNNRPTLKDGSKNPLADVRVRQALNYATDKQALIQVVTYGIGTPEQSFMPMSTPLSYGNGPLYAYDLNKAKALLPNPTGLKAAKSRCSP